jgi:CheY-like chemotaxis protein
MKTILIVEDNHDWRELLAIILRRLQYDVVVAMTGEDAVDKAFATHPDLILMDLGLPKMGGDEATVRIKSNAATTHIPIVIQTAFDRGPRAERALQAGAADIIQKPISLPDIQRILKKHLPAVPDATIHAVQ